MSETNDHPSGIYSDLLSDAHSERLLSDEQQIASMLLIEGELAQAQAQAGLIPQTAADAISAAAATLDLSPAHLSAATASAGVPVPALVKALKQQLPEQHARWVHFGATSQDIVDSALILTCRQFIRHYATELRHISRQLTCLAREHQYTLIAGRTRTQQAVPMSFGLKIANWLAPLLRQQQRLAQLQPRLLVVQLAGAVGTLSAMGDKGEQVARLLAQRLSLNAAPGWHTQRDSLSEFAGWLALTSGTSGKMALDWLWLAQSEVAEISFSNGGESSTMPQKCNPVNAEIIVASARHNAGLLAQMHHAMLQEHERSGSGWTLEWLTLPAMLLNTARALRHTRDALAHLRVNRQQMRHNLALHHGVIFAEPLTFALAQHMPRDQAAALVSGVCKQLLATENNNDLISEVARQSGVPVDEQQLIRSYLSGGATEHWLCDILTQADVINSEPD